MKKLLLANLLIISAFFGYPQSIVPASPSGAGLARSVGTPVNLYTGVPQIGVPLVSLPHPNGASIPVGLSYHAGGHKVQDVAGPVGLGWNLQAGGMITRVVKGLPDKEDNFWSTSNLFTDLTNGIKDGEHDDFYFSYPGGSGKFQLGNDSYSIYLMPYQELKITKSGTFSDCSWVITDSFGTKYYYGETTASRESSKVNKMVNEAYVPAKEITYVSSWFLTKIEYANHSDPVLFTYIQGSDYSMEYFASYGTSSDGTFFNSFKWANTSVQIIGPKYLSGVSDNSGYLKLTWSNNRIDLAMRYLTGIQLYDFNDQLRAYYQLNYFYFDSKDSWYYGQRYDAWNTCTDATCKRLGLGSIIQVDGSNQRTLYTFNYNTEYLKANGVNAYSLPPRNSAFYDHWGFSTGTLSGGGASERYGLPLSSTNQYNALAKSPTLDYQKAWVLNEIVGIGSGSTKYNLEEHVRGGFNAGGLRVSSIDYVTESSSYSESFSYQLGSSFNIPTYLTTIVANGSTSKTVYSSSVLSLFDVSGTHFGYSKVTKTNSNGSKEVYRFTNFNDHPDGTATATKLGAQASKISGFPDFGFSESKFWERGLVEVSKTENLNNSDSYTRQTNEYYFFESMTQLDNYFILDLSASDQKYVRYNYKSSSTPVKRKNTIWVSREGAIDSIYGETEFKYLADYPTTLSLVNNWYLGVLTEKTEYIFPQDLWLNTPSGPATAEALAYWTMKSKNIVEVPIGSINYLVDGSGTRFVTKSEFTTYQDIGGNMVPYHSYQLEIPDPINESSLVPLSIDLSGSTDKLSFDNRYYLLGTNNYLSTGNLNYKIVQDVRTDYSWGYNNSLITQTSTNGNTTTYEYIPLVGVSKVTDPNGRSTKYEYEEFNRLRIVRDNENNVVERYRYHYAQEDEGNLTSSLSYTGQQLPGRVMNFSSNNTLTFYGQTHYVWDFGDGSVIETSTSTTNHTYSTAGFYIVKLILINPDYDPVQYTRSVCITPCDLPD